MAIGNVGGGTLPQITGTVAGLGGGALLLPQTGSSLVTVLLLVTAAIGCGMFASLLISKIFRRISR